MVDRVKLFTTDFVGEIKTESLLKLNPWEAHREREANFKYYKINSEKDKTIYLVIKTGKSNGKTFLSVEGSIRKWWFGINGFQDLGFSSFEKAVELISEKLTGNKNSLWGFKISNLEIGINVRLPMRFKGIVDSYSSYSTFKKIWYEGETISFVGKESYTLTVYDKGEEIVKARKNKKSKKNPKPIEKLIKQKTWIRYELKTSKLSKVKELREMADTPGGILTNWNRLLDLLHGKIKDIHFLNYTNTEYINDFKGRNKTEIKNYLINIGMQTIGLSRTLSLTNSINSNKRNEVKKELVKINSTFTDKPRLDLQRDLKNAISKRIRKKKK